MITDPLVALHLARALDAHIARARRNAARVPGELIEFRTALEVMAQAAAPSSVMRPGAAQSGPERPPLDTAADTTEPAAVNLDHAAALLGVSPRTVRRMTTDGRLASFRLGRRRLVPLAAVRALTETGDPGRHP